MKKTFLISILFLICPFIYGDAVNTSNSDPLVVIKRIDSNVIRPLFGSRDNIDQYYSISSKNPDQPISIILTRNSIHKHMDVKLINSYGILTCKPYRKNDNIILFTVDLETAGIHHRLEWSQSYPSKVMFRYYQPGTLAYNLPSIGSVTLLDYLAPFNADLDKVGVRNGFGFEPNGQPFLKMSDKRYANKLFAGTQLEVRVGREDGAQ